MFTRCPDCETTFRLTAEDLRRAKGKVRCGDCGSVFNALESLAEEPVDEAIDATSNEEHEAPELSTPAHAPEVPASDADEAEDELPAPDSEDDENPAMSERTWDENWEEDPADGTSAQHATIAYLHNAQFSDDEDEAADNLPSATEEDSEQAAVEDIEAAAETDNATGEITLPTEFTPIGEVDDDEFAADQPDFAPGESEVPFESAFHSETRYADTGILVTDADVSNDSEGGSVVDYVGEHTSPATDTYPANEHWPEHEARLGALTDTPDEAQELPETDELPSSATEPDSETAWTDTQLGSTTAFETEAEPETGEEAGLEEAVIEESVVEETTAEADLQPEPEFEQETDSPVNDAAPEAIEAADPHSTITPDAETIDTADTENTLDPGADEDDFGFSADVFADALQDETPEEFRTTSFFKPVEPAVPESDDQVEESLAGGILDLSDHDADDGSDSDGLPSLTAGDEPFSADELPDEPLSAEGFPVESLLDESPADTADDAPEIDEEAWENVPGVGSALPLEDDDEAEHLEQDSQLPPVPEDIDDSAFTETSFQDEFEPIEITRPESMEFADELELDDPSDTWSSVLTTGVIPDNQTVLGADEPQSDFEAPLADDDEPQPELGSPLTADESQDDADIEWPDILPDEEIGAVEPLLEISTDDPLDTQRREIGLHAPATEPESDTDDYETEAAAEDDSQHADEELSFAEEAETTEETAGLAADDDPEATDSELSPFDTFKSGDADNDFSADDVQHIVLGARGAASSLLRSDEASEDEEIPPWQPEQYEETTEVKSRSALWLVGGLLMIVALAGQLTHYNRDTLAASASWGQTVRDTYAVLGMELYPEWSADSLEIRGSEAIAGESGPDVMDIRAQIASVSGEPTGVPYLRVVLRDRWSNPVAEKQFSPAEYAVAEKLPADGILQPNQSIEAHVSILDPGSGAQGFELELCIPRRNTGLDCTGKTFKQ